MTHLEAMGIKIYYNFMEEARENNIDLRPLSNEEKKYYKNGSLPYPEYEYLMKNMYFEDEDPQSEHEIKEKYIYIISDFLSKLNDVYSGVVKLRN